MTWEHSRRRCALALTCLLAVLAPAALAPHAALAAGGPDPTLVVASIPDSTQPPGTGNVVQAFDTATGLPSGPAGGVPVGGQPFALAIDPTGSTAYAVNNTSGTVTPITVSSLSPETTLCLPIGDCSSGGDPGTQPEAVAVAPDGKSAWVVNTGEGSLSQIAIEKGTARVVSPEIHSRDFSTPDAIAITPDGKTAWVANYASGTVVPVSLPGGQVGTPVNVGFDPTGLAVTPNGKHLFVANSGDGTVSDVNLARRSVTSFPLEPTSGFSAPQAVAIAPDGATAYVTDAINNAVVPVDVSSDTPGDPVGVGAFPVSIAVTPDGSKAYVANEFSDDISILSLAGDTPSVTGTIATNGSPDAIALTPDQAPQAAFSITPGVAGAATSFDASASTTTPAGGALTYTWDFGDGSAPRTTSGPQTTHTYANPGVYTITLTVTDAAGTSTQQVYTGQTMSLNGGPSATSSQTLAVQGAASGAAPEAIVAGFGDGTAIPVALQGGPSASPGLATGTGGSPSAVAIDPAGRTAYVVDTGSNQVTPVDMATGRAESSAKWIAVGNEPNAIAVTPDGKYAYVVNGGDTTLSRITLRTRAVSTIPVPAAGGAHLDAIAVSPDSARAYVLDAANNTITQIDLATGKASQPVGGSGLLAPGAIAVAPDGKTAYVVDGGSATRQGGVTTVDVSGATPAPKSTTTIASVGDHPDAIAVAPDGKSAYVVDAPTNGDGATVTPLTLSGTTVSAHRAAAVANATGLYGIAVTPDGASAYATGTTSAGGVIVPIAVSGTSAAPAAPVALGTEPRGIAIAPDQAPVAELAVAPSPVDAGAQETLDASASTNPSSPIASYTFDFGDGSDAATTSAPTATAKHAYATAGTYKATVTVTDAAGTSTGQAFTGQTVSRNGGGSATASQTVTVLPTVTGVSPANGAEGTKVTITGTGFATAAGKTAVRFGSEAAPGVACKSTTSCTATAPKGAGTVDVTVTVGGQTSAATDADHFTYGSGGGGGGPTGSAPTVTKVDPNSGPAGTKVTITGTNFATGAGLTKIRFGGTAATSVSCSSSTTCTAKAPSDFLHQLLGGSVDVTVTVDGQQSAPSAADKFTYKSGLGLGGLLGGLGGLLGGLKL